MLWTVLLVSACLLSVAVAMVLAAASDVRSRVVDDVYWKVSMAVGIPCSAAVCAQEFSAVPAMLVAASSVCMAFHALSDSIPGPLSLGMSAVLAVAAYLSASESPGNWMLIAPFVSSALFLTMYHVRILAGGADAKALIALSAVPQYPSLPGIPVLWNPVWPLSAVPLSVSVLVLAVILSLVPMLFLGIRNLARGHVGTRMFTEYRMPLEEVSESFVWLSEDVVDGELVHRRATDDVEEACLRLEQAGAEYVAVTPMVPFVLFIAAGLIVALLLGNPLLAVM